MKPTMFTKNQEVNERIRFQNRMTKPQVDKNATQKKNSNF